MKIYIKPNLTIHETQVSQMLAESLIIVNSGETVDGDEALIKEGSWNMWSSEEEV